MSITSDDYDEPVVTVALEAQAVDPPRMVLNPLRSSIRCLSARLRPCGWQSGTPLRRRGQPRVRVRLNAAEN